ncbi:MAG: tRNA 2-thiouridine(34) synthase MnmA [Proteobacteria bacterium]|jgi:tRNA-uridine 2-sulfurtransferase|nr:tRNA 2-thiouridine(34) synthase MnmA [Pseudomonadota bacterium]
MSGGVDSSVSAAILIEAGHDVIGLHMVLQNSPSASAEDARQIAESLKIPFHLVDLRSQFKELVVDYLADEYLAGRTPNPCTRCNKTIKFGELFSFAQTLGATHLATGHYARIDYSGPWLTKGANAAKDQSYFLFAVPQEVLGKVLFPVGELSKESVRSKAQHLGLRVAQKPESQEVCFIPNDDHAAFIRSHRPTAQTAGEIVDQKGKLVGHHDNYCRYTIGQRRGLGVALGYPAYVLDIDPHTHCVVLGRNEALHHRGLIARHCNWFEAPPATKVVRVRIRHQGHLIPCRVQGHDPCEVHFLETARAVAPGQAAVFYEEDRVLGGGFIEQALS